MALELKQRATPRKDRKDFWRWEVWLDGPDDELDKVEKVIYRLHRTFPKPVRNVQDRETKFKISSSGWGEFLLRAEVHKSDGEMIEMTHWLSLADTAPHKGPETPRLFVSYSLSDTGVAQRVIEELRTSGFDVTDAYDVKAASSLMPWQEEVASRLKSSDAVVNFVGESASSNTEALVAESIGGAGLNVIMPGSEEAALLKTSSWPSVRVEDKQRAGSAVLDALKMVVKR